MATPGPRLTDRYFFTIVIITIVVVITLALVLTLTIVALCSLSRTVTLSSEHGVTMLGDFGVT
jgi:hypothetical protein